MRNNNFKNQKTQFLSKESRAAEVFSLLNIFFDGSSFNDTEGLLSELLQSYISPDLYCVHSNEQIANTVFAVREISNLLRKLEAIHIQLKGGVSC